MIVSMFAVSVIAQPETEAIVKGKAVVIVDGIRTSGRAVFDIDLVDSTVKFGFGDYEDLDPEEGGGENWLYGWIITDVVEQGKVTVITALPQPYVEDPLDYAFPGPVPILILFRGIDSIIEGRTPVTAMGSDFATGDSLMFSGKVLELDI